MRIHIPVQCLVVVATSASVSALVACSGAAVVAPPDEAPVDSTDMESDDGVMIGMVLLNGEPTIDVDALIAATALYAEESAPPLRVLAGGGNDNDLVMMWGGQRVFVLNMDQPVPNAEAEVCAEYSMARLLYDWRLPEHSRHLVVGLTASDEQTSIESISQLVDLLAAVAETTPTVGVYIPDLVATHDPSLLVEVAADSEPIAAMPWLTGVSVATPTESTISFLSLGMTTFGLPDLMLDAPYADADASFDFFIELLVYATMLGEPIPDGDTIGRTDEERLPIRYQPSPVNPGEQVWTVVLP